MPTTNLTCRALRTSKPIGGNRIIGGYDPRSAANGRGSEVVIDGNLARMIVVSAGPTIDHCFMSDELKTLDGIDRLRRREGLPRGTATDVFNQDQAKVANCQRTDGTSNLRGRFGGTHDIEVSEDVVGLGSYGRTLTVLYDIDLPDEEDREQYQAMRDSWELRFRR
jgi:hypothetical protein